MRIFTFNTIYITGWVFLTVEYLACYGSSSIIKLAMRNTWLVSINQIVLFFTFHTSRVSAQILWCTIGNGNINTSTTIIIGLTIRTTNISTNVVIGSTFCTSITTCIGSEEFKDTITHILNTNLIGSFVFIIIFTFLTNSVVCILNF